MNAIEIYRQAEQALEHNRITIGEFEARIEPLKDVEKVTRCKDCKHSEKPILAYRKGCVWCKQIKRHNDSDWFCGDGKPKDGGTDV